MKIVITILIFISAVIPINAQRITREYNNFGFEPYNLPLSIESDEIKEQIGYLLDEQQMVFHVKSTVNLSNGLPQLYDYQIKWQSSSVH